MNNNITVYRDEIKLLYKDYNVKSDNYKSCLFDINKVEYYDDLMYGEKFLARIFNCYLDFNVLDFMIIHIDTNYPMFKINTRKIKIKKLLNE
jgi:hypothetical protein